MRSSIALVFILILTASSLTMVKPAWAQTKPAVPEFTLKYVDNSYDVPPTYSIDPYTGQNITIQAGYRVQNKSIEVIIRNQPFTVYNSPLTLFYNIGCKGHFAEYWSYLNFSLGHFTVASNSLKVDGSLVSPNAEFTVVTYALGGNNGTDQYSFWLRDSSEGGQVDFQVQALMGYYTTHESTPVPGFRQGYYQVFTGDGSGWSETQTITIPEEIPSPTAEPILSPTPTQEGTPTALPTTTLSPNQSTIQGVSQTEFYTVTVVLVAAIVALSATLAVFARKLKKNNLAGNKQ